MALLTVGAVAPNSAKFRGLGVAEVAKIDATTWVIF